jgi:lysophospholipase L1-like esterase
MDLNKNKISDEKVEIKINKKMRMWHRYKNFCIGGVAVLAILIISVTILKSCQSKEKDEFATGGSNTTVAQDTTQTQDQTTGASKDENQNTTAAQASGGVYAVSGTAQGEDYTSKSYYDNAVFLGDSIISGISYYNYVDSSRVFSDGNLTSDKATAYVDQIKAKNPSKVFIMVGLNDLNYGTRGADAIYGFISELVSQIQSAVPNANVYVLSLLPVTQTFEAKPNVKITQNGINDVNDKLKELASKPKVGFIDVASAYKDGSGYLNSSFTGNGSNLYNEYYPFLLNGIAGAVK